MDLSFNDVFIWFEGKIIEDLYFAIRTILWHFKKKKKLARVYKMFAIYGVVIIIDGEKCILGEFYENKQMHGALLSRVFIGLNTYKGGPNLNQPKIHGLAI